MMLFFLFRDAVTPTGLWVLRIDVSKRYFLLRFVDSSAALLFLALSSLGIVLLSNVAFPQLARLIVWQAGAESLL